MLPKGIRLFAGALVSLLLLACSEQKAALPDIDKPLQLSSQPSLQSLKQMIKTKQLKEADMLYLSLREKHPESNDVATAMLLLAQAHIDAGEYLLGKFYADSYIRQYPTGRRVDQAAFLRVKSVFLRFQNEPDDPILQKQTAEDCKVFLKHYSRSPYIPKVQEMQASFQKIVIQKNEEIAKAYERMGKQKAAAYYRNKNIQHQPPR